MNCWKVSYTVLTRALFAHEPYEPHCIHGNLRNKQYKNIIKIPIENSAWFLDLTKITFLTKNWNKNSLRSLPKNSLRILPGIKKLIEVFAQERQWGSWARTSMSFLPKNLIEFPAQDKKSHWDSCQELCPRTTMRFLGKNLIDVPAQEFQWGSCPRTSLWFLCKNLIEILAQEPRSRTSLRFLSKIHTKNFMTFWPNQKPHQKPYQKLQQRIQCGSWARSLLKSHQNPHQKPHQKSHQQFHEVLSENLIKNLIINLINNLIKHFNEVLGQEYQWNLIEISLRFLDLEQPQWVSHET